MAQKKKSLTLSAKRFVPGHLHVQVTYESRFITAKFRFIYLHALASFNTPESWSLGTLEMEVAGVQLSGEKKGSTVGSWSEKLEGRRDQEE